MNENVKVRTIWAICLGLYVAWIAIFGTQLPKAASVTLCPLIILNLWAIN